MINQIRKVETAKMVRALTPALLCAAALAWIYIPTFAWMIDRWSSHDSYFAHGFLIPFVSIYWTWQKRNVLRQVQATGSYIGIPVLVIGAAIQIFASIFRIYFISAFSFILVLAGCILLLYGRRVFREIWFPICFLLLMIPLPLLAISEITLKFKFFVSEVAVFLLNKTGIQSHREGSYIIMPNSYLLVGDPCSGLKSFLAFLCLGMIFAYGAKTRLWARGLLALSGLPLAILSNIVRVYALGMIAEIYGQDAAGGRVHDASGVVVFVLSFAVFLMIRRELESKYAAP